MANFKLDVKEKVKPAPEHVILDTNKLKTATTLTNAESNPFDWYIIPTNTGIKATNNSTGKVFEGTQSEFSAMLKRKG
jgi:hypothetical protein